ncbi:MAG: DUF3352 domain-containing protein, partial [Lachnospiraceae bacterium]|nr:DUF3352 domain-containing protein [Lachnospiraceae bacterium]
MAIVVRRGQYVDFDPSKLRAGEWAVVLADDPASKDGKAVYICFTAGNVKRMATYEDMVDEIQNATMDISSEITKEVQAKIKEASAMIADGNVVITNAEKAIRDAQSATKLANDTAADIQKKLNNGEFSAKIVGVS